ncbi:aldehyde dehydrogenase family protein [Bradyrhizobium diazoefficiens]|nr:aldehyde dehydrogenase family protein [Bradyrhizobium diazoefficiens]WLA64958.1 aldehyde dehydrogenase family protein [Bradyrhizobium diazoefficiens]
MVNFLANASADAGPVVGAIIAHPTVRRINFIGSTRVGAIIAAASAKYLKPYMLELWARRR